MRKPIQILLVVVLVALLGGIVVSYQQYKKAQANFATLQADSDATRARYTEAINEIATIQDSLNAIVMKAPGTHLDAADLDVEHRLTETGGDRALAHIAVIKAGIERAKTRIEQLAASLKKNNIKMAGLQKMIDNLSASVAEKESQVASLNVRVDSLQTQVAGLSTTVDQQTATIEDKRRELGTVYYVAASKKTLTEAGILVAKGGVLGLGKTLKPTGKIDEARFTALDTDHDTVIHIPAAKAKVVSDQPLTSYELLPAGGEMELRITDPAAFRTVRHVVIVTT